MNDQELYRLLQTVTTTLQNHPCLWRLGGSANLHVQEVDILPKDLDLTTNAEGLETFRTLFRDQLVKDYYKDSLPAHVLEFKIQSNEVEVIYHNDPLLDLLDSVQFIDWKGLHLPVLPLNQALLFYERTGRDERAELIRKHFKSSS
ncbi:MAG TPA: hypothetical protein VJG90_00185 [Candidatus Nanoarchaeia archaeon]|nr:hypothetical protein [Candidatus Nanoarchaeia archaeon]